MVWAQDQKLRIINGIKERFVEADKIDLGIDRKALESEICMIYGSTLRKAKEYIQQLLYAGFITEDSYGLWISPKYGRIKQVPIDKNKINESLPAEIEEVFKNG